ncbi:unnamed protein product [Symbiodinium sp. CCMP2592]|nr:unnamed protein product [Symbiodinium sp. CCMP2592]
MTEPRPPTGASESSRRSGQSVGSRQSRRSATVSVHSRASEVFLPCPCGALVKLGLQLSSET